ncbi:MAG: protein of unknown function DUF29 [Leptospirillum sp. Group II 'C75']|jgi:hypothetical protein|uniref:DUF29 domain-containing protein n=1 Tax=Leptospirillum sp. Group II 'CF-1' TaxID=1660083 RepID=UPI00029CD0CA|nr:DUF29 domain-containing protein [Leptospirillum sp. Group II 'CF-1']AKS23648.1 hypothetical protein ABH19_07695 [Leptospirillum sp. Group II 'CF-1']EIJ75235.1 MAG: protein of unknown function DUF29 [Leptospirillum sp. Group II 'C75']
MNALQDLYDNDLYQWALTNAHLLRNGQFKEIDFQHIADELEDMGKREKRELKSQLGRLMLHLLKWQFQPIKRTTQSGTDNRSWRDSIINSRKEIEAILEDSPSLRQMIPSLMEDLYPKCVKSAIQETGSRPDLFPKDLPYTQEQILSESFWPASV